jgi:hypothetical protein
MTTPLYGRFMKFCAEQPPEDAKRWELTMAIWQHTPFMTNCRTGSPGENRWREIMTWCRDHFGDECWPIHGRPGDWQTGSATVHGWTWIGFKTADQLEEFQAAWECTQERV